MLTRSLCAAALTALSATAALTALSATAALGQAAEADVEALRDLDEILATMPGADQVEDVVYYDMSSNGRVEALVKMNGNCDQGYCEWKLFAEQEDGWQAVGSGFSRNVRFEPTEGSGAVLNADDITYAYSGGTSIYMWGDLLQGVRPMEAENAEYELIAARTPFEQTARIRLEKYELDLNGDESPERIFLIGGLYYKVGQWGTPYAVFDANDELVLSGVSIDAPRIFPLSDTPGSLVLNVVPSGIQVSKIN